MTSFREMYHGCQSNCVLCCVQPFVTLWAIVHQAPLSLGFSDKNTGMDCPFVFQGSNPYLLCFLHCRRFLYLLSYWGSSYHGYLKFKLWGKLREGFTETLSCLCNSWYVNLKLSPRKFLVLFLIPWDSQNYKGTWFLCRSHTENHGNSSEHITIGAGGPFLSSVIKSLFWSG